MEGPPGFHFQVEIEYNTAVSRQVNNLDEALARLAETIFSARAGEICGLFIGVYGFQGLPDIPQIA